MTGTVGVTKAILYDVSDNTNQAFSMSVISISWGAGLILGPAVGGRWVFHIENYLKVDFGEAPFLLRLGVQSLDLGSRK